MCVLSAVIGLIPSPLGRCHIRVLPQKNVQCAVLQGDHSESMSASLGLWDGPDTGPVNKEAERTLRRVQEKLRGFDEGEQLSVSGQVCALATPVCASTSATSRSHKHGALRTTAVPLYQ